MKEMNSIVKACLEQHEGGEKFFDALDDMIRNDKMLINLMIAKIVEKPFAFLIVSGNFGIVFYNHCKENTSEEFFKKIIVVPGGLRNGMPVGSLSHTIAGKRGIFVDDSFYRGRTRDAIAKEAAKLDAVIERTYVFYDGSKEKDDTVQSFYRYYDT